MSTQTRKTAIEKLQTRRQEIQRALTTVEQQIQRTRRQVRSIQQQIVRLSKGRQKAA